MDMTPDWMTFQRLDNAAVIDFLTSTAGVFGTSGLISAKDLDNLRLVLSGINSTTQARDRSLLMELSQQHAEFLDILCLRYGTSGLCLNLIRHSLRGGLQETDRIIRDLGQGLLKKAELLFNRPFYIYRSGHCQRRSLFSTVITDFCEGLARASHGLARALGDLAMMNPNDLAAASEADLALDLEVAKALGFQSLIRHSLPMHAEADLKRNLAQALSLVTEAATELAEQLAANTGDDAAHNVIAAAEWLQAECQRLDLLEFPRSDSMMVWEVRRRNLTACLHGINESLRFLSQSLTSAISHEPLPPPRHLPESLWRRLAFDLVEAGQAPSLARQAIAKLEAYLNTNQLRPEQILAGELSRIDNHLLPRTLTLLTKLSEDAVLMRLAQVEKQNTISQVSRLRDLFQQPAAALLAIALAFIPLGLVLGGCGLKTRPTSEVVEYRPDIGFHGEPARNPVDGSQSHKETEKMPLAPAKTPARATLPTQGVNPDGATPDASAQ